MRPEDIDDLFKGKLEDHSSDLPSPLWNRLEERMQQQNKPQHSVDALFKQKLENHGTPLPANLWGRIESRINQGQNKTRPMWVWYAAACITLLLSVVGFWSLDNAGNSELAAIDNTSPKTEIAEPKNHTEETKDTFKESPVPASSTHNLALSEANLASAASVAEAPKEVAVPKIVTKKPRQQKAAGSKKEATTHQKLPAEKTEVAIEETLLAVNQAAEPKKEPVTDKSSQSGTTENDAQTARQAPVKPLNVEIILASANPDPQPEMVETEEEEENPVKQKALFAKKVAKQLWSIKNGEKPDLQEFGLAQNYTSGVKTKIQTLTKTINL